jgi:hypothetical protein
MGDLIASERSPDRARLHADFNAAVQAANRGADAALVSPLTITLGDEFQGLAVTLVDALVLVRRLRLTLLAADVECRFAIGRVRLSSPVNRERAWNMMGEGLAETRDRLNEKSVGNAYRFHLGPDADPVIERLMDAVGSALTRAERGWTDRQRTVMLALLAEGRSVEQLSTTLKVTPRAVYKIRDAAGWDACSGWWDDLTTAAAALDARAS